MSVKHTNRPLEKLALRAICADQTGSHYLLGSVNESHFGNPQLKEVYRRIANIAQQRSMILTWPEVIVDPAIPETVRESLREFDQEVPATLDNCRRLHEQLDQYRKLRVIFETVKVGADAFQQSRVNADELLEKLNAQLSTARSSKNENRIFHVGIGNNSAKVVQDILYGDNNKNYIPTGFATFDAVNRGMFRGALFTIAATTGGGKCGRHWGLVYTSDGVLELGELWRARGAPVTNNPGFFALRTQVKTHTGAYKHTDAVYTNHGPTWRVATKAGDEFEGFPDHQIYVYDPTTGELVFTRLDHLGQGQWVPKSIGANLFPSRAQPVLDYVENPNVAAAPATLRVDRYPKTVTQDLGLLLGLMVAEGSDRNRRFNNEDQGLHMLVESIVFNLFGATRKRDKTGTFVGLGTLVGDYLSHFGGVGLSANKYVPEAIRRSPKPVQAAFLRGLFEGDGSVWYADKRHRMEYVTISRTLARHVKAMLENFGIAVALKAHTKVASNTLALRPVKTWTLRVDLGSFNRFQSAIGFVSARKQAQLALAVDAFNKVEGFAARGINQHKDKSRWVNKVPNDGTVVRLINRLSSLLKTFSVNGTYVNTRGHNTVVAYEALCGLSTFTGGQAVVAARAAATRGSAISRRTIACLTAYIEGLPKDVRRVVKQDPEVKGCLARFAIFQQHLWTLVTEAAPTGECHPVYDLSVPGPHSYHTQGLISHNTTLALQLKHNFASYGAKVAMVSLEMNETEIMRRDLANWSGVSMTDMLKGRDMLPDDKAKIADAYKAKVRTLKEAGARESVFVPDEDVSIEEIMFTLKPFNYDVIIIDYISLLKGADGDDQWRRIGAIARFAKVYANNTKTIVVLLAQLSDDGAIRYSKAVQEHSSNFWAWIYDQRARETGTIFVNQYKARNQRAFPFYLKEEFGTMRIRDLNDSEIQAINSEVAEGGDKSVRTRGGSGGQAQLPHQKRAYQTATRNTVDDGDNYLEGRMKKSDRPPPPAAMQPRGQAGPPAVRQGAPSQQQQQGAGRRFAAPAYAPGHGTVKAGYRR